MTARTHDLAAITALGVITLLSPPEAISLSTVIAAIIANQIGGITPDIDQPTAPFWRNISLGRIFGRMFGRLLGGHRFLTHSLLGLALFGMAAQAVLVFIGPLLGTIDTGFVWWAYMIGMASHLVMDSFTKEGVPWLLPIPVKFGFPPFKRLRVTTGKAVEAFLIFPILILCNALFYAHNYHRLMDFLKRHIS